jgi:hypothetical protein
VLVELLITAAVLAACGTAAAPAVHRTSPAPSRTPATHGPALTGTVQTSEDVTLNTSFHVTVDSAVSGATLKASPASTCAAYAASSDGAFFPPQFDVVSQGHSLYFDAMASGYHGPDDYASAGNGAITGTISVGVNVGAGQPAAYSIFRSIIGGSSDLSVHPDGSGTFTFSEWGSDEVRGDTGSAASISGTVTWTCQ